MPRLTEREAHQVGFVRVMPGTGAWLKAEADRAGVSVVRAASLIIERARELDVHIVRPEPEEGL